MPTCPIQPASLPQIGLSTAYVAAPIWADCAAAAVCADVAAMIAYSDICWGTDRMLPAMAAVRYTGRPWVGAHVTIAIHLWLEKEGVKLVAPRRENPSRARTDRRLPKRPGQGR
jgi:hypothetical protein